MKTSATAFWERVHPAWVGLLAFLLYLRTLGYGFVAYDDPWLLRDNVLLRNGSFDSVWRVLTDLSWEQRYRLGAEYLPVRDLSVMLDFAIYGDWIGGLRLTQVLLFSGICALLATLTLALFRNRALAWLTGILFTTHPIHVEAASWLSERKGVLGSFLLCSSLLVAVSYLRRGGWGRAALACLLFLLAVGSKAPGIAGAGALVLIMLWVDSALPWTRRAIFAVCYALSGLLVFAVSLRVSRMMGIIVPYHGEGFADTLLLFFEVHTHYLKSMAYGGPYAIAYPFQPGHAELGRWLLGAIAALSGVGAVASSLFGRWRRGAVTFGLAWWLIFIAPVSHLLVPLQNYAADRYIWLAGFGLLLALSAALLKLPRVASVPIAATLIAVGTAWTIVQTPVWSSSEALFENAVHVMPGNVGGWDKLAFMAAKRDEPELAWSFPVEGLRHSPGNWRLLHRQGLLLSADGKIDAAIEAMERAASTPESHKAYANLALLYLRRGDRADALRAAEEAVRLEARSASNQRALGIVAYGIGDSGTACRAFERAFELDPHDQDNQKNLELCVRQEEVR